MAKRLLGKEVNEAIVANLLERTNALREKGVVPTLGIVRVGADPSNPRKSRRLPKREIV